MSEDTKKDTPNEPAEAIELSDQDLEQVAGGGAIPHDVTVNKQKSADKAL
jgi:hypothetical protein